jgi:CRP/FNR family transcriptional regulator, cyclic AMP receptor protein
MENAIDRTVAHRFRCFQGLTNEQIAVLSNRINELRVEKGRFLFRQGDPGDSIYLLLSGQILIKLDAASQDERTLATLEMGAIFGEVGPLAGTARTATATAATDSALWQISATALTDALQHGEAWAASLLLAIAQVLGRRLASTNEELIKLSAELHPSAPQPQIRKAVAEIEQLRKRLMTEWTF